MIGYRPPPLKKDGRAQLHRENRKLTARLKVAQFKERSACLENIDYSASRTLRKDQILELAQNRWITAHQGILITGPSGSGKSFLAQALAQHACRSGFSVQYLRLPTLLTLFVQARAQGTYDRLLKRLAKLSRKRVVVAPDAVRA